MEGMRDFSFTGQMAREWCHGMMGRCNIGNLMRRRGILCARAVSLLYLSY